MPRTKGSKNGVSRTKGYTAVGKKAKGRWINGRYVYDMPKFSSGSTETYNGKYVTVSGNLKDGFSYVQKTPINVNPAVENHKKQYDAMKKASDQGAHNNWQQRANETASNRMLYGKWRDGSVNATNSRAYMTPKGDYNPWVADAAKGSSGYMKRKAENDAMRAKVTSLTSSGAARGDAQQAALEQWKKQNQNAIATNKKFQKAYQDTLAKGAAMGDAAKAAEAQRIAESANRWKQNNIVSNKNTAVAKGAKNDWQQQANAKRDDVETYRKYKQGSINGIAQGTTVMQRPKDEREPTRWTEVKPMTKTASGAKGKLNNWQQQAAKAATGGTVPASYNWKQYNSLKIKSENRKKRDAENSKNFGKANNWQQMANKSAAAGIRNATVTTNAANAKKKAYQDSLSKGTQNNWQRMASKSAAAGERNNRVNNTAANKTKKSASNAIAKGASMNTAQQAAKTQAKAEAKKRWEEGAKAKAKAKAKADWKERRKKLKYK